MSRKVCIGQFLLLWFAAVPVSAQKLHFYRNDGKHNVYETTKLDSITFPGDASKMHLWFKNTAQTDIDRSAIDSITLGDKCQVAQLSINTTDGAAVSSRETYVGCTVSLNGLNMFPDIEQTGKIRGRGNSTWLWYPKKAYRLKLDAKEKMMGLAKSKDWVLLANYRDPTFMMNAIAFELGDILGLQYTNHSRFVELTLNGNYMGLYLLTEQVEQGKNRVEVNDSTGVLLSMDVDDGPTNSPDATDNFWSQTYSMPMCVKYPKDEALTDARKEEIKADFGKLEALIRKHNYAAVKKILDVPSLINYLLVQEMTCNVELAAPRSMFIYKGTEKDSLWHLGPLWDFDAGFAFDWSNMTVSRHYFIDNYLILGQNPEKDPHGVASFFIDLFNDSTFKNDFNDRWQEVETTILPQLYSKLDNYKLQIEDAMARDEQKWSFTTKFDDQYAQLQSWLNKHVELMNDGFKHHDPVVDPNANVQIVAKPSGVNADYMVTYKETVASSDGYSGGSQNLNAMADSIAVKLGLTDGSALADAMGSVSNGEQSDYTVKFDLINNTTGKDYADYFTANGFGCWLDGDGDVCSWSDDQSRFYVEVDPSTWLFSYGTFPGKSTSGHTYTATFVLKNTTTGTRVAIRFVLTVN